MLLFFSPIPCTYTSLPQDGMAKNYYIIFYMDTSSCLDPFYPYLLIPEVRKKHWSELESNPGSLASQATALTTRPWLLKHSAIE